MMKTLRRRLVALLPALPLMAAFMPAPAYAWGKQGHQVIAMIAEDDLLKKLKAHYGDAQAQVYWNKILQLISSDPWLAQHPEYRTVAGEYHLADIVSWADWLRSQDVNADHIRDGDNVADHSVRLPLDGSPPLKNPPCTPKTDGQPDLYPTVAKRCADQAVTDFAPAIANSGASVTVQQTSLRYVAHLVGDLHQPLHASDPIGYNYVSLPGHPELDVIPESARWPGDEVENPNFWFDLHVIWDSTIVSDYMKAKGFKTTRQLADFLIANLPANPKVSGTPRNWAEEGRQWAASSIYSDGTYPTPVVCWSSIDSAPPGGAICDKNARLTLDATYTARKAPIVVARLEQAGLRLSCVLYKSLTGTDLCNP